ncbi:MAG: radical SAM protein [Oscillospiraceae bacterium]|nr:radical SAM protein [Oscillospiraceae bacterium]
MQELNETKKRDCVTSEPDISWLLHEKGGRMKLPVSGTFELTAGCNFHCRMCYIHTDGDRVGGSGELTVKQWLEIGRQARAAGMVFLLLTGGEPLLRKDFAEIYEGLKSLGLVISVNTNGYFLDGEIAELFRRNPPSRLNISLYGADNETYERVCGVPVFTRVEENIRKMKELGISVRLNCSITPDNCRELEKIQTLISSLDLHAKATTYMYPPMRTEKGVFGENACRLNAGQAAYYRVKRSELHYSREEFLKRCDGLLKGIELNNEAMAGQRFDREPMRCRAGKSSFWINWRGEMSACGVMCREQISVPEKGFSKAWEQVYREAEAIRLPLKCSMCQYRHFCNVCAAVCYCETGGFDEAPAYICELSENTATFVRERAEELRIEQS